MLKTVNLGQMTYEEGFALQKQIQQLRISDRCEDTLLLLEHTPVLTKGLRSSEDHILLSRKALAEKGIQVYESSRGGDVTYHGPGQIVCYIIMKIEGKDIRCLVQKLEQVTINIMKRIFDIEAYSKDKTYTGVFVGDNKLTALGIGVNKKVTMHGFAMNVNTDLSHFDWIVPCGLKDRGVTSVERLTGRPYDIEHMKQLIIKEVETLFETKTYEVSKEVLLSFLEEVDHEYSHSIKEATVA